MRPTAPDERRVRVGLSLVGDPVEVEPGLYVPNPANRNKIGKVYSSIYSND